MKHRFAGAVVVIGALVLPGAAVAAVGDKATGGGQVLFSDDDVKRSTIAFTAQQTADGVKGQVQFIDRSAGAGKAQEKYHGRVTCIEVENNAADITGIATSKGDTTDFYLRVVDNGEGAAAQNDLIEFDSTNVGQCANDDDDDDRPEIALAKGNAQVRDGDSSNPSSKKSMSFTKALKLAGLK